MSIQLSFDTMGISSNDMGELVSPTGAIITREFLLLSMRYNSEESLAEDVLGIDIKELKKLFKEFGLTRNQGVCLTKNRIKIMSVIKRYLNKYHEYPEVEYVSKRCKMDIKEISKELQYLSKNNFIEYKAGKIMRIVREV